MRDAILGGLHVKLAGGSFRYGRGDDPEGEPLSASDAPLVVLLHGYGAPGDDLLPLWRALDVPRETRFCFPAAPLDLGYGASRAWWQLDPAMFEDASRGIQRDRSHEVPPGLATARDAVRALLDDAERTLGATKIVLGGFSQGSMVALDVALHDARPLAGLALLSSTLIARPEWEPRLAARAGLPVLLSHGDSDPLLPFAMAERLRDLLRDAGLAVDWVPFRGGHAIPDVVIDRLGRFLTKAFE